MAAIARTSFGRPAQFATAAGRSTQAAELFTAHRLTTTIALLAAAASCGGLFVPDLYRDNAFVTAAWKGTDVVTLFVAVPGHSTSVVFALDLSLLVPVLVLGALWLLRREPWGYLVAGILCVKGVVYPLALAAGSAWAWHAGVPGAAVEAPFWLLLSIGGLAASALLIGSVRPRERLTDRSLAC